MGIADPAVRGRGGEGQNNRLSNTGRGERAGGVVADF